MGWLSKTHVILGFLVAMLLIGFSFQWVMQASGGPLLDAIFDGEAAMVRLAQMDANQRAAHFKGTVFLDSLYPIAYAGFFGSLIARFAGRFRWYLILLPIITALADYGENIAQALALSGGEAELLLAKDILTPLKFGCLVATLIICVLLLLFAFVRMLIERRNNKVSTS